MASTPSPRARPRRRLRTNILISSAALAVLVGGLLVALVALTFQERSAEETYDRNDRIVRQANLIQKLTLDLETGQRGFVITGESRFLEPWFQARAAYRRELTTLRALSEDTGDAPSRTLARALSEAGASYLSDVSEPLVAATRRSPAAGRRDVLSGEGKRHVDRIRSLVDELIVAAGNRSRRASERENARQRDAIVTGVVGAAAALTLIALFALYLLRGIVRPVRLVGHAADLLSGGDLSQRVPVAGPHEVAQLGESFNHMASALESNRDERAQAEQALRDSEARLQAILDNSTAVIFVKDLRGRHMLINRRFEDLLGVGSEDILGKTTAELLGADIARALDANDRRVVEAGEPIEAEEVIPQHGEDHTYLSIKFPLRDPVSGSVYAVCGMSTDITDRKRAERIAEEAKREAEAANQAKSRFLSRMSHELRTPLNAILGFGQVLELDDLSDAQSESVEQILKGGRHLLQLINEVLEISRIEAGELPISMEPVDVQLAVGDVVELMGPLAAERGIGVNVTIDDSAPPYARADNQRLRQVLLNLFSNGIKYNRPHGSLSISLRRSSEGRVRLVVADTGLGIAPDQLPRLFNPFDRLSADERDVEGTGLGLALSERLVEAMGGTIAVESEVGTGTTFSVELEAAEAQVAGHDQDGVGSAEPDAIPGSGRRTVLCIEDNVSNVKLLERIFSRMPGVDLLAAGQGSLGIELAHQHRPDLILLDLNLPDTTGDEVLRELQRHEATRRIPVVVLSADATERQVERLLGMGVRDYLTKPFEVKRLLEVVDQALNARAR